MFQGQITDCFEMPGKGLVVMLTDVQGTPTIGALVDFLGGHRTIVDIGRATPDGQPVTTRDRVTGQEVPPQGAVVLEWSPETPAPKGIRGAWVKEIKLL